MLLELRLSCLPETVPSGASARLVDAIATPGLTVCLRVLGEAATVGDVACEHASGPSTGDRRPEQVRASDDQNPDNYSEYLIVFA